MMTVIYSMIVNVLYSFFKSYQRHHGGSCLIQGTIGSQGMSEGPPQHITKHVARLQSHHQYQTITTNSNTQEEADRINTYRLVAIGVKEGVAVDVTKIFGKDIFNTVLRALECVSYKSVDDYQLHQLITVTEGAERPKATTIRQQFINIDGMVFNWRDTVAINIENFVTNTSKTQAYGIPVHNNLKAVVILANVEWAAHQSWGTEISVAHRTIKAKYRYNPSHNTALIK